MATPTTGRRSSSSETRAERRTLLDELVTAPELVMTRRINPYRYSTTGRDDLAFAPFYFPSVEFTSFTSISVATDW
jgi:hypothetical protein